MRNRLIFLLLSLLATLLGSCASQNNVAQQEKPPQAFGQADSTIPWNNPQSWEGQMGGFNSLSGHDQGN